MARDVYSLRIYAAADLLASTGEVGPVVPAGFVYVVRDIDVRENLATAGAYIFVKNPVGGILWIHQVDATVNGSVGQWRGRQVYAEGEQVGFQVSSGDWAVTCSGYQLTLP